MKKIVILYSTSGHGHMNSAKAIMQSFERERSGVDIKFVNILDNGNSVFKFLHFSLYVSLMKYAKWVWGAIYYFSDLPFIDLMVRAVRHLVDHKTWGDLEKFLIAEKPDAIVSTHFFLTSVARKIKKNGQIRAKLYLMVSGYGMHNIWFSRHIDHFFTGIGSVSDELVKRGVSRDRVTVTGMPAPEEYVKDYDAKDLAKRYGLDESRRTVFILSGAYGAAPMEAILDSLKTSGARIQVIVVCGYNKLAYDNILRMKGSLGFPVLLFGFTDKIAELMAISDMMISKAGTLSVTQAMNMGLPMLLFSHVPGHETPTVKMLVENGAAMNARNIKEIPELVDRILLSREVFKNMKFCIDKLRRRDAADKIAEIVLLDLGLVG
ncbi:MAG: hypothetical protein HQL30_04630 [Candidatus Omnitrophica bacterium]|nr:hypothetical protein [Candidatus Omnitrophota bacterium]